MPPLSMPEAEPVCRTTKNGIM